MMSHTRATEIADEVAQHVVTSFTICEELAKHMSYASDVLIKSINDTTLSRELRTETIQFAMELQRAYLKRARSMGII